MHLNALACTKLDVIGQQFHAAVKTTRISRGQRKQLYGHNLHNRRLFSRARSGDIERVSRFALAHRNQSETAVVPCNTGTIGLSAIKNACGYREGQCFLLLLTML